jgi:hypothetical protein
MHVGRHDSPAGWLLQKHKELRLAFPLWELACQRMLACGDARLQARFASRLAPTKDKIAFPLWGWSCQRSFAQGLGGRLIENDTLKISGKIIRSDDLLFRCWPYAERPCGHGLSRFGL